MKVLHLIEKCKEFSFVVNIMRKFSVSLDIEQMTDWHKALNISR